MAADPFTVLFRPEIEFDLRPLSSSLRRKLLRIIQERLAANPLSYGKPLGSPLAGLRRVRTGDYRIAYQVRGDTVVVWAIRHRKDIYSHLDQRWRKQA